MRYTKQPFDVVLRELEQERQCVTKTLSASQSLPLTCGACCPVVVACHDGGAAPLGAP